jgi:hypothetical protein
VVCGGRNRIGYRLHVPRHLRFTEMMEQCATMNENSIDLVSIGGRQPNEFIQIEIELLHQHQPLLLSQLLQQFNGFLVVDEKRLDGRIAIAIPIQHVLDVIHYCLLV